jgi:endoglucanase
MGDLRRVSHVRCRGVWLAFQRSAGCAVALVLTAAGAVSWATPASSASSDVHVTTGINVTSALNNSPGASVAAAGTAGAVNPAGISRGTARRVCRQPAPASTPVTGSARQAAKAARPPAALIRVDQVGYPTAAPKLAEIMTASMWAGDSRQAGGTKRAGVMRRARPGWVLVRAGTCAIAASGVASRDLGSWSRRYSRVWAVRFSGVRAAGRYRIGLAGHPSVASPWFEIGLARRLYARPLANALSFYRDQRDGPDFIRSPLRTAPGNLNDARAMTYRTPHVNDDGNFKGSLARLATGVRINASGGWFDAGDNLHFVETTSFTVAALLQGIVSFPGQLGQAGQVNFTGEAKFGLDFLQRMWNERTRTLYYQVGTGEANNYFFGDHDIWRLPQADDHYKGSNPRYAYIRHPPVFRAARPGSPISPNLAGRLAASFALCYRVYRGSHPAYAARCLRSAETVYALAGTRWKGKLLTVAPYDFYPETSWRDDMMLGATELSLALAAAGRPGNLPPGLPVRSAAHYLRAAAAWAHAWVHGTSALSDTLNLYDVSALADYELDLAIGKQHVSGLAITRAALLANLRGQLEKAIGTAAGDPFGFGFRWDQWDTAAHGSGLAVMANSYDALVHRPVFAAWAQRWLDDILGANAWGVSLIVGDGTVFPNCLQHQIANLVGSHDGKPPVLAGAVVEGPNSFAATGTVPNMRRCAANAPGNVPYSTFRGQHAVFADNVQSYSTVEPAIDLTALTPLAFGWQYIAVGGLSRAPP